MNQREWGASGRRRGRRAQTPGPRPWPPTGSEPGTGLGDLVLPLVHLVFDRPPCEDSDDRGYRHRGDLQSKAGDSEGKAEDDHDARPSQGSAKLPSHAPDAHRRARLDDRGGLERDAGQYHAAAAQRTSGNTATGLEPGLPGPGRPPPLPAGSADRTRPVCERGVAEWNRLARHRHPATEEPDARRWLRRADFRRVGRGLGRRRSRRILPGRETTTIPRDQPSPSATGGPLLAPTPAPHAAAELVPATDHPMR